MIVTYDDSENVLSFVNSQDAPKVSQVGAACPDHLVHTKRLPLFVDWDPNKEDINSLKVKLETGLEQFVNEYIKYFNENKSADDKIMETVPRVILIPGLGMINTGKSWSAAKVSESLYHRAIAVMEGTSYVGRFVSLDEAESFAVEYWPLELYKLTLAPPEAEFSRQVALVTGGAGGIGRATCERLVSEGANVVIADIDVEAAKRVAENINEEYGENRAIAVHVDVTKEEEVQKAIKQTILTFGGLDILVNNAGLASSSSFEETTRKVWDMNIDVLVTGYFLVAREAFDLMKRQNIGGSMVFVGSKNSIHAGGNAAAYNTAKAAEMHLARSVAVDGGPYGIRVNSVLPDAVIQGSKIWDSDWKEERASSHGIELENLEEHYRNRTILKVNILPEDVAETIAFLASSKSSKTTGTMVTVDGGVVSAFVR